MVEYNIDSIFHALADPTRRDILERVSLGNLSIKELAAEYEISFAAVSKHVMVLDQAKLVSKNRDGRQQIVTVDTETIHYAQDQLSRYEKLWETRFDQLDVLLNNQKANE